MIDSKPSRVPLVYKLRRREAFADRCRGDAFFCYAHGIHGVAMVCLIRRYERAARLVELTAFKLLVERRDNRKTQ